MAGEKTELKAKLDDGSCIHLTWLRDGSLAVQRFKSGSYPDGHGWLCVGSGVIDGAAVQTFLDAKTVQPREVSLWDEKRN